MVDTLDVRPATWTFPLTAHAPRKSSIAAARLEKDIFVRTHLHTARIVVRIPMFPVGHAFGTTHALRTSGHLSCRDTFARPKGVRSWQVICLHFIHNSIDTRSVVCEFECFLFYKSVYITDIDVVEIN